MNSTVLAVFVVISVACVVSVSTQQCSYSFNGDVWNLAPMTRTKDQGDYTYISKSSNSTFFVNICAPTNAGCNVTSGVCQEDRPNMFVSCGNNNDARFASYNPNPALDGVTLIYGDGQTCNGVARVSYINVLCNRTVSDAVITFIDEVVECRYTINMQSQWGCKNNKPKNPLVPQFSVPIIATGYLPSSPTILRQRTEKSTAQGDLYFDQTNGISKFNGTVLKPDVDSGKQAGFMRIAKQGLKVSMPLSQQCDIGTTRQRFPLLDQAASYALGTENYTSLFFHPGETVQVTTWAEEDSNRVLLKLEVGTGALVWADGRLLDANGDKPKGWTSLENYQVEADWKKFKPSLPPNVFSVPSAWNCL